MAIKKKSRKIFVYYIYFSKGLNIIYDDHTEFTEYLRVETKNEALELLEKYGGYKIEKREKGKRNTEFICREIVREEDKNLSFEELWNKYSSPDSITIDKRKNKK